jgi:hypothetical protein
MMFIPMQEKLIFLRAKGQAQVRQGYEGKKVECVSGCAMEFRYEFEDIARVSVLAYSVYNPLRTANGV